MRLPREGMKWAWAATVPLELAEDAGVLEGLAQIADRKRDEHMPGYVFLTQELMHSFLTDEEGETVLNAEGEPIEIVRYVRMYGEPQEP